MSLKYILEGFAQDTGIPCIDYGGIVADPEQRKYALRIINEAARELWNAKDLSGSLEEVIIFCETAKQISLPSFVGSLRALREVQTELPWKLSTMRPRYYVDSWADDAIRTWRDKGFSPIAVDILNIAPPKIVVSKVESPNIKVTITGTTDDSQRISETKTITSLETVFENSFTGYFSVKKDRISEVNVILKDADDREMAIIYNDELESSYRIVDCSEYLLANIEDFSLELCYKKALKDFFNDADEFPVPKYDDVILNKAMQIWNEKKGTPEGALLYDKKAERTAGQITEDQNKGKDIRAQFFRHRHDNLFSKYRRARYY
jgi:hypothetical protein